VAEFRRMWVNCPSTLQPLHRYHGTLGLALPYVGGKSIFYLLDGDVVSMIIPTNALSFGWPLHLRKRT
jgi:hypothetical protein